MSVNIKIVGTGLIGTSIGLALARKGITAQLADQSASNLKLAIDYGAGAAASEAVDVVVVCVPPDLTATVVIQELAANPNAIVTDVASVKSAIRHEVDPSAEDPSRYIGSHPMAGREAGGPKGARADLFFARPWVITPGSESSQEQITQLRQLALEMDALPIVLSPQEHDASVALVSHLPQLISSALAGRLLAAEAADLSLTGQGLRDTTRIAASDPAMWLQILQQNANHIAPLLAELKADIDALTDAFQDINGAGSLSQIHRLLTAGNDGVAKVPGKHGGKYLEYKTVTALIDDSPGALASLLTFIGEKGINLEDIQLEHSPGAPIGLVELQVLPQLEADLISQLTENGWRLA